MPGAAFEEVEDARRMHALGIVGTFTIWLPIFIWLAHLGSLAALVPYLRNHPSKWWIAWIDTGVCAAAVIACIVVAIAVGVSVDARENDGTAAGRTRFLAWHGVLAGLANLALILAEGSYVLFISPLHR